MLNESLSLVGQILILEPRPGGKHFPVQKARLFGRKNRSLQSDIT
jgi:hypothetical protein